MCKDPSDEYVGVASVPGIPMSIAWGRKCLRSGGIPYDLAVINTALVGGLQSSADWWLEIVDATLKYFNVTYRKFEADVLNEMDEQRREDDERERS